MQTITGHNKVLDIYIQYHFKKEITFRKFQEEIDFLKFTKYVTTGDGYLRHNIFLFDLTDIDISIFKIGAMLSELNIDKLYLENITFSSIMDFKQYVIKQEENKVYKANIVENITKEVKKDMVAVRKQYIKPPKKDRSFKGLIFGILSIVAVGLIAYNKSKK